MRFFLATEYDFNTKTWISGGRIIPKHAWAESTKYEIQFPVLNDQMMFLHNKNFWTETLRRNSGPYNWENELHKLKKERVHFRVHNLSCLIQRKPKNAT